jgi:hypothetical protein
MRYVSITPCLLSVFVAAARRISLDGVVSQKQYGAGFFHDAHIAQRSNYFRHYIFSNVKLGIRFMKLSKWRWVCMALYFVTQLRKVLNLPLAL